MNGFSRTFCSASSPPRSQHNSSGKLPSSYHPLKMTSGYFPLYFTAGHQHPPCLRVLPRSSFSTTSAYLLVLPRLSFSTNGFLALRFSRVVSLPAPPGACTHAHVSLSHQPRASEVPRDDRHRGDETEDVDRRPDRGKLEVLSLVVLVPTLEALDEPQRGNEDGPVVVRYAFVPGGSANGRAGTEVMRESGRDSSLDVRFRLCL